MKRVYCFAGPASAPPWWTCTWKAYAPTFCIQPFFPLSTKSSNLAISHVNWIPTKSKVRPRPVPMPSSCCKCWMTLRSPFSCPRRPVLAPSDMSATACNEMWCKSGQMRDLSKPEPCRALFFYDFCALLFSIPDLLISSQVCNNPVFNKTKVRNIENVIVEPPPPAASRSLVMIAKCLQNLANLVEFGAKESYMEVVNPFILKNKERMVVFLDHLSVRSIL